MSIGLCAPARAQFAGSATVSTNLLYRGGSFSDGDPALSLAATYDGPHGVYAGGALLGDVDLHRGAQILGHLEYMGLALKPSRGPTWDFGVSNSNYKQDPSYAAGRYAPYRIDATEFHVGMIFRSFSYFAYFSPNYFDPSVRSIYNELTGVVRPGKGWRLVGHVGVLDQVSGESALKPHVDLSAGLVRPFKGGEGRVTWTTTFNPADYPAAYATGRGLVALDVTVFF
jgi:hypothetical protein